MKGKDPGKKSYSLDDIGFIGTQEYKSFSKRQEEIRLTGEAIRKHRAEEAAKVAEKNKK